jgi:hypothetical protein
MNLSAFLARGAAYAPPSVDPVAVACEATRAQWLNALLVDQTRAWMAIGEADEDTLTGMTTMLAIAGMADVFDSRSADTPALRVIRGAISASDQCKQRGCVVRVEDARAWSAAAERAVGIIQHCTHGAIQSAAIGIRKAVGLPAP